MFLWQPRVGADSMEIDLGALIEQQGSRTVCNAMVVWDSVVASQHSLCSTASVSHPIPDAMGLGAIRLSLSKKGKPSAWDQIVERLLLQTVHPEICPVPAWLVPQGNNGVTDVQGVAIEGVSAEYVRNMTNV